MKLRIISWNVRGVTDSERGRLYKVPHLITKYRPYVFTRNKNSECVGRDIEELKIGKIFRLGGGLVFWDKRVWELDGMKMGGFSISCCFKCIEDGFVWIFSKVYEPTSKREREGLWAKLGAIKGLWEDLYCVGSDFNKVRFSWERNSKIGCLNP